MNNWDLAKGVLAKWNNFTAFFTFQVQESHDQKFKLLDILYFPERNLGSKRFGFYLPGGNS